MNFWENLKMALDSIKSNKMRSFLTMLGIIIGISSVIAIVSLGQGGQNSITGEFSKIGASTVSITVRQSEANPSDYITFEDVEQIKNKISYIQYATPSVDFNGTVSNGKKSKRIIAAGGTKDLLFINNTEVLEGRYFTDVEYEEAKSVMIIDAFSAKTLFGTDDVVGKTVDVASNYGKKKVTIIGVAKSQFDMFGEMSEDMNNMPVLAYFPATFLTQLFQTDNVTDQIYIMADSKDNAQSAGNLAKNMLENRHGNRDRNVYKADSLMKQLDQINKVLGIFTTFIAAVAAISLLVGGVGVMNIMLVSVTERTREIGIRKAIGAKTGNILFQFLTESVIISCIGGIIGLLLGLAGAYGLGSLAGITPSVSPSTVMTAILFSSAVGIFFGIYPARKAAKLDPIEALRYE